MKRTPFRTVALLIVGALVVAYLIDLALVSGGLMSIVPPISLPLTLVVIAVAVVGLAVPVRRRVSGKRKAALSPFYAVRVAVLAKSCTLTGSLLVGVGLGILIHVMSRPVSTWELIWPGLAQTVGSAILLAAGLIAERMCTLPPNNDADTPEETSEGSHV